MATFREPKKLEHLPRPLQKRIFGDELHTCAEHLLRLKYWMLLSPMTSSLTYNGWFEKSCSQNFPNGICLALPRFTTLLQTP